MLKKKILIIGSSKDIIKTFSYLYKNNQVTNLSFRKVWDRPHLIKYYDTIICSGFHHNICLMNSRILHGYVQKYYYFILKLKKNCKKLYLVSTSISVDISISKVVFFY